MFKLEYVINCQEETGYLFRAPAIICALFLKFYRGDKWYDRCEFEGGL